MDELKDLTIGELKGLAKELKSKGFTLTPKNKRINYKDFEKAINDIVDELNKEQNKNNKFYNIQEVK